MVLFRLFSISHTLSYLILEHFQNGSEGRFYKDRVREAKELAQDRSTRFFVYTIVSIKMFPSMWILGVV